MFTPLIDRLTLSGKRKRYPGPPPGEEMVKALRELTEKTKHCDLPDIPMDELDYTVIDTETTGFYPHEGDEIISLGAVKMRGTKILTAEKFDQLVNPFRPIPEKITLLTGIDNNATNQKKDVFTVLRELMEFIGDTVVVGHALGLDLSFINRKLKLFCNTRFYNIIIDTKGIAMIMFPPHNPTDLDSLLHMHGIESVNRHTALGDALLTARLFGLFIEKMRCKNVITVRDLDKYLDLGNNYAADKTNNAYFYW